MDFNNICDICIEIIEWWSNNTPLSYGTINVLLFIILQPLLITSYFVTTLIALKLKTKKAKTILAVISIVLFIFVVVCGFLLVFLPYFDITTDMIY